MVEGARLERVCRGNSTEGSNPSLSAIALGYLPEYICVVASAGETRCTFACTCAMDYRLTKVIQAQRSKTPAPALASVAWPYLSIGFNANFAPSATKAAAKVRRIQLMTRGLEITLSRLAAANMP